MGKFKIIEEGRLSESAMEKIVGGKPTDQTNCGPSGYSCNTAYGGFPCSEASYSTCASVYEIATCGRSYNTGGTPGGGSAPGGGHPTPGGVEPEQLC